MPFSAEREESRQKDEVLSFPSNHTEVNEKAKILHNKRAIPVCLDITLDAIVIQILSDIFALTLTSDFYCDTTDNEKANLEIDVS